MAKILEIMFDDLNEDTQKEVLQLYGYESPAEGNLDVIPLFVLQQPDDADR